MVEISYNEPYTIPYDILINTEYNYYFRLETKNRVNETLQVKLYRYERANFNIKIYGVKTRSHAIVDTRDIIDTKDLYSPNSIIKDSNYSINIYNYSKLNDEVTYIFVLVHTLNTFNYFSICVGDNCTFTESSESDKSDESSERDKSDESGETTPNSESNPNSYESFRLSTEIIILIVCLCFVIVGIVSFFIFRKLGYFNCGKKKSNNIELLNN